MARTIYLDNIRRDAKQISMTYRLDELRFETSYWYDDVNLLELEDRCGRELMEKIYFHMLVLESSKLISFQPTAIALGDFSRFHTAAFESLWQELVVRIWAQWRYLHNVPNYAGPVFQSAPVDDTVAPVGGVPGDIPLVTMCGGGKDSLVALKLLEEAGTPFASYAYSHSIYGRAQQQHPLIDGLLDHAMPRRRHKHWVYDSLLDSPALQCYPELDSDALIAAETPSSLMGILPLVLQHGYQYVVVGHERSANRGNLIWDATGEDVNHQWGKSLDAEDLLGRYVRAHLVSNVEYFSILQPIYDVVIFNLLRQWQPAVRATHSCNIAKPWCGRCAKCAYVWLNFMAYLPTDLVDSMFGSNLFDIDVNQTWFQQMLGLGQHTPFECIGQIPEARLAFELCTRKGLQGHALDVYQDHFPQLSISPILERFLPVEQDAHRIPAELAERILPRFLEGSQSVRDYIGKISAMG